MINAMTSILIFGGTIALLVLALEPAQRLWRHWSQSRRDGRTWSTPGENVSLERERQRIGQELRFTAQFDNVRSKNVHGGKVV